MYTEALAYFDDHAFWNGSVPQQDGRLCTCLWLSIAGGCDGFRAGTAEAEQVRHDLAELTGTPDDLNSLFDWNDSHTRDEVRDVLQILAMREQALRGLMDLLERERNAPDT
jgi:hypothetical protein